MRRLARPDPLIILIGGVVIVCGALGLFSRAGLEPDAVAQLEAGAIMIASAIRMYVNRARGVPDELPPSRTPTTPGG